MQYQGHLSSKGYILQEAYSGACNDINVTEESKYRYVGQHYH